MKGTKERQVASIDSCFTEKRGAGRGENVCPPLPMRCLRGAGCFGVVCSRSHCCLNYFEHGCLISRASFVALHSSLQFSWRAVLGFLKSDSYL